MTEILKEKGATKLTPDLIEELNVLYQEYSAEKKGFPDGYCIETGKDISGKWGFRLQEGCFQLDLPNKQGTLKPTHTWCIDAEKVIIDFTAHQFNPHLRARLFEGVHIVHPGSHLYERYHPNSH